MRSVTQSCLTLCNPMNHSTPGLPVHHQFPEFTETHVHRVSDAIQPSHPLSSPSPLASNPSQQKSALLTKPSLYSNPSGHFTTLGSQTMVTKFKRIWLICSANILLDKHSVSWHKKVISIY